MSKRYETLLIERDGDLAWITFNRPTVSNAFNLTQWRELREAIRDAEQDSSAAVIALRGAGRGFSAGYDLSAALEVLLTPKGPAPPNAWRDYVRVGNEACWAAWDSAKPVIAAVHGYCLGGAFDLAMACDFVIGSDDSTYGEPEVRLSDAPSYLIAPWLLGLRRTKDLLLTGDVIGAERAYEFGILTRVCRRERLEEEVRRLARKLSAFPNEAWRLNKAAINRCFEIMGLRTGIEMGVEMFALANVTPTELKMGFGERFQKEGLSAALKWAQSRFAEDDGG